MFGKLSAEVSVGFSGFISSRRFWKSRQVFFKNIAFAFNTSKFTLFPHLLLVAYDSRDWSFNHCFGSFFLSNNLVRKFPLAISYKGFIFPNLEQSFWYTLSAIFVTAFIILSYPKSLPSRIAVLGISWYLYLGFEVNFLILLAHFCLIYMSMSMYLQSWYSMQ